MWGSGRPWGTKGSTPPYGNAPVGRTTNAKCGRARKKGKHKGSTEHRRGGRDLKLPKRIKKEKINAE